MAGRRRIQRSVRVTVAASLIGVTAVAVTAAVVWSFAVGLAALIGVVAGVTACRIMYVEVTQTRWVAAREHAAQARDFRDAQARQHAAHQAYSLVMAAALRDRDRTIGELGATLRLLERRAVDAEGRARHEARRANEAQQRLAAVLDEVLGTVDGDADAEEVAAEAGVSAAALVDLRRDLPTVVDLIGWDAKGPAARSDSADSDSGAVA